MTNPTPIDIEAAKTVYRKAAFTSWDDPGVRLTIRQALSLLPLALAELEAARKEMKELKSIAKRCVVKANGRSGGAVYMLRKDDFLALKTALSPEAAKRRTNKHGNS